MSWAAQLAYNDLQLHKPAYADVVTRGEAPVLAVAFQITPSSWLMSMLADVLAAPSDSVSTSLLKQFQWLGHSFRTILRGPELDDLSCFRPRSPYSPIDE